MCAHGLPFARSCAHGRKCNVQNLRFYPYIFVLRMRATYCVQRTACNVLRATYCVQRTACNVLCAKYLRTACRRVGTKPSPSAGYIYGCMFAQLCTQPFHNNFNFIRYRIFTTALLPTGNTYDSVTVSVIRYMHVPLLLIIIHCVVTGFTN